MVEKKPFLGGAFSVTLLQSGKENRVQIQNTPYHQDSGANVVNVPLSNLKLLF
jgi:hypothetical protein